MAQQLITVFGGSGFLGREIVRQLLAAHYRVRVAVRGTRTTVLDEAVEQVPSDVSDANSAAVAVEGASAVVNAVGLYVERGRATFEAVHIQGAENVAAAAKEHGARLVHVSGIGVNERSASSYVRSRALGERRVRERLPQAVILRPSVLFGPDDAFLSTLERVTRLLPVVPLFGTGDTRLQPVFVGDVAEAVVRVVAGGSVAGATYELGGPIQFRYRDVMSEVLAHLKRKRVLLPVPFIVWEVQSACLAMLPSPPLTRDQVILMRDHNVVGDAARGFADLDMVPRPLADLLPECLPQ